MKRMVYLFVAVVAIFVLSGCADNSQTLSWASQNIKESTKEIYEKSYTIGQAQNTFIGEPVIKVKKIAGKVVQKDVFKPLGDFSITVENAGTKNLGSDDIFYIQGKFDIKGIDYTVIYNQKLLIYNNSLVSSLGVLVAEDGSFAGVVARLRFGYDNFIEVQREKYKITPYNTKFKKTIEETTKDVKSVYSYELIYTGKTPDSLMITYREYTGDDMARPAFFQNLTYSSKQNQIRFKNLLIEVVSADNEKIVFKVLED